MTRRQMKIALNVERGGQQRIAEMLGIKASTVNKFLKGMTNSKRIEGAVLARIASASEEVSRSGAALGNA